MPAAGEMNCATQVNGNFSTIDTQLEAHAVAITAIPAQIAAANTTSLMTITVRCWR